MAKLKKAFFCKGCGAQFPQWMGKCTSCNEWNTLEEEVLLKKDLHSPAFTSDGKRAAKAVPIDEIVSEKEDRIVTGIQELDRVLGGGIVNGSVSLIGGEPGIGKSTLMLQLAMALNHLNVVYVSGEESAHQIKLRAERLRSHNKNCLILTETNTQNIFSQLSQINPDLVIIDSIQTLRTDQIEASPGSVSQIRECSSETIKYAKENSIPIFLVGHITKEGSIAGPKILEHMVDVVLQFEGDRNYMYRLLRSIKNRFGSTHEIGIFEMLSNGLRQVLNPSELLIVNKDAQLSGSAITSTVEGMRPMLLEIQALVSTAVYGTPQRSATGFDTKRMNMLLAVLEKRAGFKLGTKDVFLNITGGLKIQDPAVDLGIIAAVLSSNCDLALPSGVCFAAEVGLSGEVRPVSKLEQRISEAEKLGYKKIFISSFSKIKSDYKSIKIQGISKVEELVFIFFSS